MMHIKMRYKDEREMCYYDAWRYVLLWCIERVRYNDEKRVALKWYIERMSSYASEVNRKHTPLISQTQTNKWDKTLNDSLNAPSLRLC